MFTKKGFTLIELLVVVLIIGILAAIAVPQYQVAVVKSRYATLKNKTRSIAEAVNRYHLANGTYPTKFSDLDISFADVQFYEEDSGAFGFRTPNEYCHIYASTWPKALCGNYSDNMEFYFDYIKMKPEYCYTKPNNQAGIKVCQQETGKTSGYCEGSSYCLYFY